MRHTPIIPAFWSLRWEKARKPGRKKGRDLFTVTSAGLPDISHPNAPCHQHPCREDGTWGTQPRHTHEPCHTSCSLRGQPVCIPSLQTQTVTPYPSFYLSPAWPPQGPSDIDILEVSLWAPGRIWKQRLHRQCPGKEGTAKDSIHCPISMSLWAWSPALLETEIRSPRR